MTDGRRNIRIVPPDEMAAMIDSWRTPAERERIAKHKAMLSVIRATLPWEFSLVGHSSFREETYGHGHSLISYSAPMIVLVVELPSYFENVRDYVLVDDRGGRWQVDADLVVKAFEASHPPVDAPPEVSE